MVWNRRARKSAGNRLTRCLQRQVLNLEADDITPVARRQIATRIGELETAITRHQADAERARAATASTPSDVDEIVHALARLLHLADRIADLPQAELHRLYDALNLQVRYQSAERVIDVEITPTSGIAGTKQSAPSGKPVGPLSQVCSVPRRGKHCKGKRV